MNLIGGSSSVSTTSGMTQQQQQQRGGGPGPMVISDPTPPSATVLQRIALGQLRFVEKLGEGQYGKVWKGELAALADDCCMGGEPTQVK